MSSAKLCEKFITCYEEDNIYFNFTDGVTEVQRSKLSTVTQQLSADFNSVKFDSGDHSFTTILNRNRKTIRGYKINVAFRNFSLVLV